MIIDLDGYFPAPAGAVVAVGSEPPASPRGMAEQDIVALLLPARTGDLEAQSELIRRYRPRLAGFVRARIRDHHAAEDVVQAISAKVVRRLPGLRALEVFEPWLFTLARNTVHDHFRRARCRPVLIGEEAALAEACDPAAGDRSREILEAVEEARPELSPLQQRLLGQILRGASYQQIARAERISLSAVKVKVYRLRQKLWARVGWPRGSRRPEKSASLAGAQDSRIR
jgi:RNA polymerase sigma-70 factor (ECF subfamily)